MYHTVYTREIEQHTHRFLWRNMDITRPPDTYVIQRVSFGDKPSGAIATIALRKTAEFGQNEFPEATKVIKENSYMDDIIDSTKFFEDMNEMNDVKNKRSIKPECPDGDPTLIIFSDGSKEAYGACAYVRWRLTNGKYDSQLLLSKNRLAPLKRISIDRI